MRKCRLALQCREQPSRFRVRGCAGLGEGRARATGGRQCQVNGLRRNCDTTVAFEFKSLAEDQFDRTLSCLDRPTTLKFGRFTDCHAPEKSACVCGAGR